MDMSTITSAIILNIGKEKYYINYWKMKVEDGRISYLIDPGIDNKDWSMPQVFLLQLVWDHSCENWSTHKLCIFVRYVGTAQMLGVLCYVVLFSSHYNMS